MKRRGMTSAYARRTFKPHRTRVNEARLANIIDREFDGYEPRTRLASDLTCVRVGGKWAYVCLRGCLIVCVWDHLIERKRSW